MVPVMKILRQHGIDIIFTDCDGNIQKLIPLWLDVGLNCMFPYEVNAGNDVVAGPPRVWPRPADHGRL